MPISDGNWIDLYESHILKELKEHRKSLNELKNILHRIEDIKKQDNRFSTLKYTILFYN